MRPFLPFLLFAGGLAALFALRPLFEPVQPHGVSITRGRALEIADREAARLGGDPLGAWRVITWDNSPLLEQAVAGDRAARREANDDPVVSARLGSYYVAYFRRGAEKFPTWADVYVDGKGTVLGARLRLRNEDAGTSPAEERLRPRADAVVRELKLPGGVKPAFDSARPTVFRNRTDWNFRYRVPSAFPTGRVAFYVSVYFAGDRFAGWMPIEEYADGSIFRGEGSAVAAQFGRFVVIYGLLLWLIVLFLRKYHAGEVGVGTAALLFAACALVALVGNYLVVPAASLTSSFGPALDGQQTAVMMGLFKFLFFDLPAAVLVFLAWSVGESYARERWGERLASFDSLLHRDPLNATVGRSLLRGLLSAPAVAASALLVAGLPVLAGWARPTIGVGPQVVLGLGGAMAGLTVAAGEALLGSVAVVLFVVAFFGSHRLLAAGVVAAAVAGSLVGMFEPPIAPPLFQLAFGAGAAIAAALLFLGYDLLTSFTAIFAGSLIYQFFPFVGNTGGEAAMRLALVFAVPVVLLAAVGMAGLMTGREVAYSHEDLAPHVRRIVERERVKAEIDAANRIQAALLPRESPRLDGATVSSHYRAATEIGGDYFDFLPQPDGGIGIAFGDVSGHGLTSGIVMSMAKSALLVQVDYDASPRVVLQVLNDIVMRTAPRRILMTFFFGVLDPRSQTLRFSSAGHLDPYVFRAATGRLEALSSWGFPLGVRRRDPFREHSVEFAPGDRLVLYSDGLIEAIDDDGEPFGFDRFERTIVSNGEMSADDMNRAILSAVRKFTRNRPPEDDQTLVVIAFEEPAAQVIPIDERMAVGMAETVH